MAGCMLRYDDIFERREEERDDTYGVREREREQRRTGWTSWSDHVRMKNENLQNEEILGILTKSAEWRESMCRMRWMVANEAADVPVMFTPSRRWRLLLVLPFFRSQPCKYKQSLQLRMGRENEERIEREKRTRTEWVKRNLELKNEKREEEEEERERTIG